MGLRAALLGQTPAGRRGAGLGSRLELCPPPTAGWDASPRSAPSHRLRSPTRGRAIAGTQSASADCVPRDLHPDEPRERASLTAAGPAWFRGARVAGVRLAAPAPRPQPQGEARIPLHSPPTRPEKPAVPPHALPAAIREPGYRATPSVHWPGASRYFCFRPGSHDWAWRPERPDRNVRAATSGCCW
jgi:hypothetical protein